MTREEILNKEVLKNSDIQALLEVKKTKASEVINAIKHTSNILDIRGIVHIKDYLAYVNRNQNIKN